MSPKSMFEATSLWHEIELPAVTVKKNAQPLSDEEFAEKKSYAKKLLKEENEKLELTASLSKGDRNFVNNILQSGTLSDKVSALTLLVQESPLHSLKTMDTLMTMTQKKARKEAVMAVESLKDLFVGSVLPDRKLIYFADRPLNSQEVEDRHLILWAFEDHLKKFYFKLIQQMEALSHDPLEHVRLSMIRCFHDLLTAKPEQEQNLLKLLVNKLGDKENKVAAKTSQLLVELLIAHPGMKMYVVREIEQLLLRPGVTQRAQYYSLITLNQTILSAKDKDVANKLIEIYFIFFRRLLSLSDQQEKEDKKEKKNKKNQDKGSPKDSKKYNKKDKSTTDKVHKLDDMESKMISAILTGVNRAFHFAELADEAVEKHLEVLFKITHTGTFNAAIQALSLIFSITLVKQIAVDRFYRLLYESMLDPRLITTSKQAMYLNLLFKAIRADADLKRVKAFVKRMVQIAGYHQPPFICGIFYILSQLSSSHPSLRAMLTTSEEEDEEEHYEDVKEEDDEKEQDKKDKEQSSRSRSLQNYYDGRQRDPRFAKAETSCLWELIPFRNHYHPTVSKYADILFRGEKIEEQPEMHLHTLIHFLDRFVYRNPKKTTGARGKSLMQPLAARQDGGVMLTRGTVQQPPVNSEEFWRQKIEQVPVDEIFFHKYFTQKRAGEASEAEKRKKRKLNEDEDDFDDDEVYRAMMASMPGGLNDEDLGSDADEDEEDEELFDEDELAQLEEEDDSDVQMQEQDDDDDDDDNDIPFLDDEDNEDDDEEEDGNGTLSSVFAEAPSSSDDDDDDE